MVEVERRVEQPAEEQTDTLQVAEIAETLASGYHELAELLKHAGELTGQPDLIEAGKKLAQILGEKQ